MLNILIFLSKINTRANLWLRLYFNQPYTSQSTKLTLPPIFRRRTVELSSSIQATFEPVLLLHLYPRSSIDIYIQILEVDGCKFRFRSYLESLSPTYTLLYCPHLALLQTAINATTLALISAGLPLSDYVCALTLASYPSISPSAPPQIAPFTLTSPSVPHSNAANGTIGSGSTTILDLCQAEEIALPCLTVAVLPRSGKVSLVSLETRVGVGRFEEMLRWGVEGAKVVQEAMEEVSFSCTSFRDLFGII